MSEHRSVLALARQWRGHAAAFREFGAVPQALVLEKCAEELEQSVSEWQSESLSLTEAAEVSGYSADHLGRLVREGKLQNRGRPGAPRVARGDLPVKSGARQESIALSRSRGQISRTAVVRSAIARGV